MEKIVGMCADQYIWTDRKCIDTSRATHRLAAPAFPTTLKNAPKPSKMHQNYLKQPLKNAPKLAIARVVAFACSDILNICNTIIAVQLLQSN